MNTLNICNTIETLVSPDQTLLIGIDGLGGAGKSTFSNSLYSLLVEKGYSVTLLHIDDFIHPKNIRYNSNYEEWYCYYNLQWRYDYILENIITPIKRGDVLNKDIELYNKDDDTYYSCNINVPLGSIVIIEGIFLQREELQNAFNYTIYIDVSESVRLDRVLKRDLYIGDTSQIQQKYENRYFPAERRYIAECSPAQKADITIKEFP